MGAAKGWTVEDGSFCEDAAGYYKPVLEDDPHALRWYARYFVGEEHETYVGKGGSDPVLPFAVSFVREMDGFTPRVRGIIWTVERKSHVLFQVKKHNKSGPKTLAAILEQGGAHELVKGAKKMIPMGAPAAVVAELVKLEEFMTPTTYKIGVLHVRPGQGSEEMFFANDYNPEDEADAPFGAFLSSLGTTIPLEGWDGYKAGLDTAAGGTGELSVFTSLRKCDVMFHVAAYLPHDTTGQEVQRKRQIGNDVTAIVFCDRGAVFNPSSIDSQFLHVYAVVTPGAEEGTYELTVTRQNSVTSFGPLLTSPVFRASHEFVDFLLTKLINGERAALKSAPIFVHTKQRTVRTTLNTMFESYKSGGSSSSSSSRSSSSSSASKTKGELAPPIGVGLGGPRDAIVERPTSDTIFEVTSLTSRFEGQLLGMAKYKNRFVFSTSNGVFLSEPGRGLDGRRISKRVVSRIVVLEYLGIVVGTDAKKGTVRVWSLPEMESVRDGSVVEEVKVDKTKGSHTWVVAKPMSSTYLAVAKGKSIVLFKWVDAGFVHQHTYVLPAKATVLRFLGTSLIVAFEKEFDTLELETSEVRELFVPNRSVTPLDVLFLGGTGDGGLVSPLMEMVLCYDNKGVIVNLFGEVSRGFELRWTARPSGFAFVDPYVLAVTNKYIEVRTILNGTLIQRISLPAPIQLHHIDSSVFVSSGVKGGSEGMLALWEVKPDVAGSLLELNAISESVESTRGGHAGRAAFKVSLAGARLASVAAAAHAAYMGDGGHVHMDSDSSEELPEAASAHEVVPMCEVEVAAERMKQALLECGAGDDPAVDEVVRVVKEEEWPRAVARMLFPPLVHVVGGHLGVEDSAEFQSQALATGRLEAAHAPIETAVAAVMVALPEMAATVAAVRSVLMAVRRLKQFVDSLVSFCQDAGIDTSTVTEWSEGIADVCGDVVLATKEFSTAQASGGGPGEDGSGVRDVIEQLADHSAALVRSSLFLAVFHDAEHVLAFVGKVDGLGEGGGKGVVEFVECLVARYRPP